MNMYKEKRSYPRKTCFLPVSYATADSRAYQEFIQDISTSGAFVETRHLLSVGKNIAMTFSLPISRKNIKINGRIARATPHGLGIAFMVQDAAQKKSMNAKIADI